MSNSLRIALLVETNVHRGRGVLSGIYRYARPNKPWFVRACPPTHEALKAVKAWQPQGIIIHMAGADLEAELEKFDVPVVCVSNAVRGMSFPYVCFDDVAVGAMGAEHYLTKGFSNFAFFGSSTNRSSQQREEGFQKSLRSAGMSCRCFYEPHFSPEQEQWGEAMEELGRWLVGLPKPAALMGYTDSYALMASEACLQTGIKVPSEIAILGADNDELICNRAYPTLSSIDLDAQTAGYMAARLLERGMAGRKVPRRPVWIRPTRVVTRESSDVLAVSDPYVVQAEEYIRSHVSGKLTVNDVAKIVPISRRALEKRFQAALRRTPLQEIQRVRVLRAQELLLSTEMSVSAVAKAAGFRNTRHFWENFRRHTGLKPLQFRRQGRHR